jgi:endonuclease YncB( thermonuclease family)
MDAAYVYRATCERVIDGDTYVLRIDLGFRCAVSFEARLHGIDCPERNTTAGKAATLYVENLLIPFGGPAPLIVRSYKDARSFARWVCDVWVDDEPLADLLRAAGHEKA